MTTPDQHPDRRGDERPTGGVRGAINELLGRGDRTADDRQREEQRPTQERGGAAGDAGLGSPGDPHDGGTLPADQHGDGVPQPGAGGSAGPGNQPPGLFDDGPGATQPGRTQPGTGQPGSAQLGAGAPDSGAPGSARHADMGTGGLGYDDPARPGARAAEGPDDLVPQDRHTGGSQPRGADMGGPDTRGADMGGGTDMGRGADMGGADMGGAAGSAGARTADIGGPDHDTVRHGTAGHDPADHDPMQQDTGHQDAGQDAMHQDAAEATTRPVSRNGAEHAASNPAPTGTTDPGGAGATKGQDAEGRERLVTAERAESYGSRWDKVKGQFVDEPRQAVADADALVGELLSELQTLFTEQRQGIERSLAADETSTEDMRLALRRYRSFFDRLLSI